jgi:hypothetical protein
MRVMALSRTAQGCPRSPVDYLAVEDAHHQLNGTGHVWR